MFVDFQADLPLHIRQDGNQRFMGFIDEVIVCASTLSAAEMQNLMLGIAPVSAPVPPSPFLFGGATTLPRMIAIRLSGGSAMVSWSATPRCHPSTGTRAASGR